MPFCHTNSRWHRNRLIGDPSRVPFFLILKNSSVLFSLIADCDSANNLDCHSTSGDGTLPTLPFPKGGCVPACGDRPLPTLPLTGEAADRPSEKRINPLAPDGERVGRGVSPRGLTQNKNPARLPPAGAGGITYTTRYEEFACWGGGS